MTTNFPMTTGEVYYLIFFKFHFQLCFITHIIISPQLMACMQNECNIQSISIKFNTGQLRYLKFQGDGETTSYPKDQISKM